MESRVATGQLDCVAYCKDFQGCTHFTYLYGYCYLKSSSAGRKSLQGAVSASCSRDEDDTGLTDSELQIGECEIVLGKDMPGHDLTRGTHNYLNSIEDCVERCRNDFRCAGFTYLHEYRTCYLKSQITENSFKSMTGAATAKCTYPPQPDPVDIPQALTVRTF